MDSFKDLIFPISVEEFAAKNWCKTPLFLTKENNLKDILTIEEIDTYLGNQNLTYPLVRVVGNGTEVDKNNYALQYAADFNFIDKEAVFKLFNEGHTIVIQGAHFHFPNLTRFVGKLEKEMSIDIHANIYITPSNSQGFHPHLDTHEVFVLQVAGSKTWNLYDMPIKAPQKGIQITDTLRKKYLSSPPAHQIVLQEGDVLYVPRGVVHDAFTEGEFSIHITFGFHPVLKIDFLKRLTSQLEMHSFFREPYFPLFNECDLEQSKKEIVEKVTKQLINVLDNPPAYDIYKSKYKDTQNMFTHLLLLDSLESIQDLEYIEITTNSNVEEELNEEESAFFNKVIDYQLHTDSSVFNDMSTEDFKKLFKDLIVKGFIKTINTQEIIPR